MNHCLAEPPLKTFTIEEGTSLGGKLMSHLHMVWHDLHFGDIN